MKYLISTVGVIFAFAGTGCDDDSSATALPATGATASVLCGISESGSQQLVYDNFDPQTSTNTAVDESLDYAYSWTCAGTDRTLSGNGVPNHVTTDGEFASKITAQTVAFTFPLDPALGTAATDTKEPGYAINSIKLDPATAGRCPDTATQASDCDPGGGTDTWQMVALPGATSPWLFGFGVDTSNAHAQKNSYPN